MRCRPTRPTSSPRRSGSPTRSPPYFGIAALVVRHDHDRGHRDGPGGAGRASASRCSSRTTRSRRLASAARLRHRPARRGALDHLRHVGHPVPHAEHGRASASGSTTYLGFIPLFQQRPRHLHALDPHRRRRARDHDPADHLGHHAARCSCRCRRAHIEASLALGATRWEMVRQAIFPFARPGMISASMLGLGPRARRDHRGRAHPRRRRSTINWHITEPGGNTFAANIALKWNEAGADRALGPHRHRARALRHHPRGQHGGAPDHRPPLASSRGRTHDDRTLAATTASPRSSRRPARTTR